MKKILLALFMLFSLSINAQYAAQGFKMTDDYKRFLSSTTYVVLTDNAEYDTAMVQSIKKYWKLTPYKFINYKKDLPKKVKDKKASFLLLINMSTDESSDLYNCLALINGGKPTLGAYEFMDMMAYCPTNHFLNEKVMYQCAFRVKNMVQSIISSLDIVQKNELAADMEVMREKMSDVYNQKAAEISKRILLICPEIIGDKIDEDDFKKTYPYQTEFCKKETIERIIATGDYSFYYLQVCATAVKSVFVIDPASGEIVYADISSGKYFAKDNLKHLAKTIERASK